MTRKPFGISAAFLSVLLVLVAIPAAAPGQSPVNYSVYFLPGPGSQPDKASASGGVIERQVAIVYNVGQRPGTHSYKLLLRAWAPGPTVACETTVTVRPWEGRYTMKKVAAFEVFYKSPITAPGSLPVKKPTVKPGNYSLIAYLMEEIPSGEARQDTDTGNNQYPFDPPDGVTVQVDVRPQADEVRCVVVPLSIEHLPPAFKVPQPRK